ncbi:proteoglycan 4-like isoform X3 [Clytia hemisphaerica]|uniref:proteoglycan 4-like isoform X3 n=1 Tax=Clytia hemisphaerica TaxID=252671 RepID=UPI0034D552EC
MADNEERARSRRASRRRSCLKTIVGNQQDDTTGSTNLQPRRKSKRVSFDHYRSVKIFEKDSHEKDEEDEKTEFLDKTSHAEHDMDLTRLTELSPSGDDLNETQKIQNFFKLFSDDKPTTKNGMDTTLGMPSLHSESPHVNNNKTILNNYDVMDEASETFVSFPLDRTKAEKETKISSADFLSNFKSTKDKSPKKDSTINQILNAIDTPPESSLVSGKDFLAKLISHKTPSENDYPPPGAIALELNNITILSEASMNITDDENQRELMLNQLNMSAAISPSSNTKTSLEAHQETLTKDDPLENQTNIDKKGFQLTPTKANFRDKFADSSDLVTPVQTVCVTPDIETGAEPVAPSTETPSFLEDFKNINVGPKANKSNETTGSPFIKDFKGMCVDSLGDKSQTEISTEGPKSSTQIQKGFSATPVSSYRDYCSTFGKSPNISNITKIALGDSPTKTISIPATQTPILVTPRRNAKETATSISNETPSLSHDKLAPNEDINSISQSQNVILVTPKRSVSKKRPETAPVSEAKSTGISLGETSAFAYVPMKRIKLSNEAEPVKLPSVSTILPRLNQTSPKKNSIAPSSQELVASSQSPQLCIPTTATPKANPLKLLMEQKEASPPKQFSSNIPLHSTNTNTSLQTKLSSPVKPLPINTLPGGSPPRILNTDTKSSIQNEDTNPQSQYKVADEKKDSQNRRKTYTLSKSDLPLVNPSSPEKTNVTEKPKNDRRLTFVIPPKPSTTERSLTEQSSLNDKPKNQTIVLEKVDQSESKKAKSNKDRRLTIQDMILAGNEKCIDDSTNFEQTLVFKPPIANSSMMVFPSDGLVSTENTPKAPPLSTKETTSNETFVVTETKQKATQNHTSQSLETPGSAENIDDQFIQSGANEVPITNKTFVVEEPSKMEKTSKTLEMNFTKETLLVEEPTKTSKTMEKTFTKETLPVDVSSFVEEQASSLVSQAIAEADLSIAKENQPTLPNEETLKNEIVQQIMSQLAVSQANTNIAESVPSQQKDEIQRMVMNMLQKYNLPTKETITPVATADQTDREPTELLMDVQAPDGMEDSEITTNMKYLQNFDNNESIAEKQTNKILQEESPKTLAKSSPTFENESTSPVELPKSTENLPSLERSLLKQPQGPGQSPKSLGQKPSTPQNNATPTKDLTKQFDEGEQTLRRSARKKTPSKRSGTITTELRRSSRHTTPVKPSTTSSSNDGNNQIHHATTSEISTTPGRRKSMRNKSHNEQKKENQPTKEDAMDFENVADPFASKPKIRRDTADDIDQTEKLPETDTVLERESTFTKITTDERLVKSFVRQTVYDAEKSVIRETADGFTKSVVETNDVVTRLVESNDVDMEKNVVVEKTLDSKEDDRNQTVDTKNQTIDDFTTPKGTSSSKKKRRKRMNMPSSRKPKTKVMKENSPPIQKKKHNFQASDGSFTVEDLDDATLLVNFPKYKHFHCLIKHQGDSLNDVIVGRNYHNTKQFKQGAQSLTAQDEWYYSCVEQSISNQKLSEKYTDMTEVSNLISELKRLFTFWQPFIVDLYEVVRRSQGEVTFTDHSLTCEMLDLVNYRGSFTFQATFDLSAEKPKPIFWLQHDTRFKIHGLEDLTNDAVLQTSFFPVYHYYKMLREFQKTRINIEFDHENAGDVKKYELALKAYL